MNLGLAAQEIASSFSGIGKAQDQSKRLYNYAPSTASATNHVSTSTFPGMVESGTFTLKKQYAFDKMNDREKDLFEDYQRRINESVQR